MLQGVVVFSCFDNWRWGKVLLCGICGQKNFVGNLKTRWKRRRLQAEILELTGTILPFDGSRVRHNEDGDPVFRRSILSVKSTTGSSVQLRQHGACAGTDPRTYEHNLPDERASERSRSEAVSNVHTVPAEIGVCCSDCISGYVLKSTKIEPAIITK